MASEVFVTKKYVDDKTAGVVEPVLLGSLTNTSGTLSTEVQTILKKLDNNKPYTFYYYDGNTYFYSLCYYFDFASYSWLIIFVSETTNCPIKTFKINTNYTYTITDMLSTANINALSSGITSAKVSTYDGYASQIAGKQTKLTGAQQQAVDSGITSAKVSQYDGYKDEIAGKQDELTSTQLNAVNSGITSAKVSQYDGYASGKQNALNSSQLNAVNSGITSAKVGTYDGYNTRITTLEGKEITITDNDDDTFTFTWGE